MVVAYCSHGEEAQEQADCTRLVVQRDKDMWAVVAHADMFHISLVARMSFHSDEAGGVEEWYLADNAVVGWSVLHRRLKIAAVYWIPNKPRGHKADRIGTQCTVSVDWSMPVDCTAAM
jgi:hypothetical protein